MPGILSKNLYQIFNRYIDLRDATIYRHFMDFTISMLLL